MRSKSSSLVGRWRFESMEAWDREFIDLVEPGYVELRADGSGEFMFGCVFGTFAWPPASVSFIADWAGDNEMDPASGLLSAEGDGSRLVGEIRLHLGEESEFIATAWSMDT